MADRKSTKQAGDPDRIAVREAGNAPDEISKIIDTPVALNGEVLRGDTRLTRRWTHGAIHDPLPGMRGHVVMTYYGGTNAISWRSGAARVTSRTRPSSVATRFGVKARETRARRSVWRGASM